MKTFKTADLNKTIHEIPRFNSSKRGTNRKKEKNGENFKSIFVIETNVIGKLSHSFTYFLI